ncbi:MAG TPA: M15 family metallopeptidase [Candidatus Acidoferrum sp.]|nr:M15 family metallopeptidase [Candidatus Acidoferrum sp.]
MDKRKFLLSLLATGGAALVARHYLPDGTSVRLPLTTGGSEPIPAEEAPKLAQTDASEEAELELLQENELHPGFQHPERPQSAEVVIQQLPNETLDQYLEKIRNFDHDFSNDIYLSDTNAKLLLPTLARLERVQSFVGYANFNLIGYEEMLFFARNYPQIGKFEPGELAFMEEIFNIDAKTYGFFGDKITPELNYRINARDVQKIEGTGHYLIKGESLSRYQQIRKDVGRELTLTSGIRNNVKQMHLFLAKAVQSKGNMSRASRSLAPPGHSYHGVGDFDVGKIGLGESNFTADFSNTAEYKRLISLGYVDIRYTDTNRFGVRYEPWHIKIEGDAHDHCSHGGSGSNACNA